LIWVKVWADASPAAIITTTHARMLFTKVFTTLSSLGRAHRGPRNEKRV
jgi:hypothetical protein